MTMAERNGKDYPIVDYLEQLVDERLGQLTPEGQVVKRNTGTWSGGKKTKGDVGRAAATRERKFSDTMIKKYIKDKFTSCYESNG